MFEKNQWFRLSVVLLLALIARVALAAEQAKVVAPAGAKAPKLEVSGPQRSAPPVLRRKKGATPAARASRTPSSGVTRESISTKSFPVELSAGPGLAIWNGETGFLFNVGATTPVSRTVPIHVGLDFGVSFWSPPLANTTGLQLLVTGLYKFDLPKARSIHPYAGMSLGPNILISSVDSRVTALTGVSGTTSVKFEWLFRPGVAFDVSRVVSIAVEPKLGILAGDFIFAPATTAVFAL